MVCIGHSIGLRCTDDHAICRVCRSGPCGCSWLRDIHACEEGLIASISYLSVCASRKATCRHTLCDVSSGIARQRAGKMQCFSASCSLTSAQPACTTAMTGVHTVTLSVIRTSACRTMRHLPLQCEQRLCIHPVTGASDSGMMRFTGTLNYCWIQAALRLSKRSQPLQAACEGLRDGGWQTCAGVHPSVAWRAVAWRTDGVSTSRLPRCHSVAS